jgi:hypothetical protein
MKNKETILNEIRSLATKLTSAGEQTGVIDIARELYEKAILFKHLSSESSSALSKESKIIPLDHEPVNLFSNSVAETTSHSFTDKKTSSDTLPPIHQKISSESKKGKDLKSLIGINEKFQFINELFEGNMQEYTLALDQINNLPTLQEAQAYMEGLRQSHHWSADNEIANNFQSLLNNVFSK